MQSKYEIHGIAVHTKTKFRTLFCEQPIRLRKSVFHDLRIGAYSYIQGGARCYGMVEIGRYCSIGENFLANLPYHPTSWLSTSPCQYKRDQFDDWLEDGLPMKKMVAPDNKRGVVVIGNDVWIGRNVTILRGVTIGDGSIIGAGTIVTHDVAPYSIVAGIPARLIRQRFPPDVAHNLMELKWWEFDRNDLVDIDFSNPTVASSQIQGMEHSAKITRRESSYMTLK